MGMVPNGVMAPRVHFNHPVSEMGSEPLEPVPGGEEQALRAPSAADSQAGADTQADVQSLPVAEDNTPSFPSSSPASSGNVASV